MAPSTRRPERRGDALSRERIINAAVEMLDVAGESGLTFRALTARLKTGPGAVYWHVPNKDELLLAATDAALTGALAAGGAADAPEDAIRAVALGVFDTIDAHPWVGTQLSRTPAQPTLLRVFERIGRQVQALGVPASAQFTAASVLLNYILGVAGQNAANARTQKPEANRVELLAAASAVWADLDPGEYPFTRNAAGELRDHDDRVQFIAGIDLVLAGISNLCRPSNGGRSGPARPAG